jgi:hypothetical protein
MRRSAGTRVGGLVAVLALTLGLGTACSEDDAQKAVDQARDRASSALEDADLPDLNSEELEKRLNELAEKADCAGLKRELAKAENNDTEVTRYIKAQLRKADC